MRSMTKNRLIAALFCAASLAPSVAKADITGYWVDSSNWLASVTSMPDFDQRRGAAKNIVGLPGGGDMYCAVAASMDLLGYVAAHGYPAVKPGNHNWQLNPPSGIYNLGTNDIAALGAIMGTSVSGGTGGQGMIDGINAFLAADVAHQGWFTVSHVWATPQTPVSLNQMGSCMLNGSVGVVVVGWYSYNNSIGAYLRGGGHVLGLAGASSPGLFSPANISWMDPWTEDSKTMQSTFSKDTYDLQASLDQCGWLDASNNFHSAGYCIRPLNYGSARVDGVVFVTPKYAFTADQKFFVIYRPIQFKGNLLPAVQRAEIPEAGPIVSMSMDPADTVHPYIAQGEDFVSEFDMMTGKTRVAHRLPHPKQVVVGGPHRNRFVLTGDHLVSFSRAGDPTAVTLDEPLDAIAFDGATNEIVGVAKRVSKLYRFDADTLRQTRSFALPEATFIGGNIHLSVHPTDKSTYVHCDGSVRVFKFAVNSDGFLVPAVITMAGPPRNPLGLEVDEAGKIFVTVNGKIKSFNGDGSVARSPFNGLAAHGLIGLLHSFSNFDPATQNGPAFNNVTPPMGR